MKYEVTVLKQVEEKIEVDVKFPLFFKNHSSDTLSSSDEYVKVHDDGIVLHINEVCHCITGNFGFEFEKYYKSIQELLELMYNNYEVSTREEWETVYQKAQGFIDENFQQLKDIQIFHMK